MDPANNKRIGPSLPLMTALIVGAAVLVAVIPGAGSWFVYDRAAILRGELWRLFTCHWVHFSASHLIWDALALGMAGWLIESRRLPQFPTLFLVAPPVIGVAMMLFQPELVYFGGLSGLAIAAVVFLLLSRNDGGAWWNVVRVVVAVLLAMKIGMEVVSGKTLLTRFAGTDVIPAVSSHIAGAASAAALMLGLTLQRFASRRQRATPFANTNFDD